MKGFIINRSKAPVGEEEEMIMLKKMRERKGFTLAELLIVVAIIGVLVAIAIPIFTSQLERSRDAVSAANARAAYAEAAVAKLNQETVGRAVYDDDDGSVTVSEVLIKGETETESGKAFQSGGSFALPFEVPTALAKALDKKANDDGISIKFTWDTNDKCTGALGS